LVRVGAWEPFGPGCPVGPPAGTPEACPPAGTPDAWALRGTPDAWALAGTPDACPPGIPDAGAAGTPDAGAAGIPEVGAAPAPAAASAAGCGSAADQVGVAEPCCSGRLDAGRAAAGPPDVGLVCSAPG
jgi:hypothetical protein